jgi:F0F1-type ATP synthase delta subunit
MNNDIVKAIIPIIVAHLAVLTVLVIVVKRLLFNDTMKAVARIQDVEAELRKKEESIRREIVEHETTFAKQKVQAEEELQRHKAQTEKELARVRDQMLAEAKKESDRILEQAHKNEERFRQRIVQEMEQKAVGYAGNIVRLVLGEKVSEEVNREFNEELIEAIEGVDADSITVDADEGEVKTSQAMMAEQKRRLDELLSGKFGRPIRLVERIDPALLSGMILKLGSLEIDGSLRNRIEEAIGEVTKAAGA